MRGVLRFPEPAKSLSASASLFDAEADDDRMCCILAGWRLAEPTGVVPEPGAWF